MPGPRRVLLALPSYFKGNRFFQRCRREGCRTFLLTLEDLRNAPWARDQLNDLFFMPSFADHRNVINGVAYLMRKEPIDCIVALDDYDVDLGALLREHFRLPGLGSSTARLFRDKLAMRVKARECGFPVPDFVAVLHHDDVRHFLATVPAPWLMKPRSEASSIGIKKFHDPDSVWRRIDELGDDQSFHLIERFVPGDLYHVDSLVHRGRVLFAEVGRYHRAGSSQGAQIKPDGVDWVKGKRIGFAPVAGGGKGNHGRIRELDFDLALLRHAA